MSFIARLKAAWRAAVQVPAVNHSIELRSELLGFCSCGGKPQAQIRFSIVLDGSLAATYTYPLVPGQIHTDRFEIWNIRKQLVEAAARQWSQPDRAPQSPLGVSAPNADPFGA